VAPRDTLVAMWAALAEGAEGLALGVQQTKDGAIVCFSRKSLYDCCGDERAMNQIDADELCDMDAGSQFRPVKLDHNYQPLRNSSDDYPWKGHTQKNDALEILSLYRVLQLFSGHTRISIVLPTNSGKNWKNVVDKVAELITEFRAETNIKIIGSLDECTYLILKYPTISCIYRPLPQFKPSPSDMISWIEATIRIGACALNIAIEWITELHRDNTVTIHQYFSKALENSSCTIVLNSHEMRFSLSPNYYSSLESIHQYIDAILVKGILPMVHMAKPLELTIDDHFRGTQINRGLWSAGYSHDKCETAIHQDDGLNIDIKEGDHHSGGGLVSQLPIRGIFDARVMFTVRNAQPGTTFEIAAIAVDPGYLYLDHNDRRIKYNASFDVLGAPPYVSSECNENNGFRCGWNNGFSLAQTDNSWNAYSFNMYNEYGRDVGKSVTENFTGELRLIRNGAIFSSYYREPSNNSWVCSGAMRVPGLGSDIHIRLAAKHWNKDQNGNTSANQIIFKHFKLYQR